MVAPLPLRKPRHPPSSKGKAGKRETGLFRVRLSRTPTTRTIYVPSGETVRLRETVRNAKVWVKDSDGEAVPGRIDLPEGWYALPLTD